MAASRLLRDLALAQQLHLVDNVMANERIAREFGLGLTDMQTLHLLLLRPEVTTARAISEASGLPTSTVADTVDRLERGGWVERQRDSVDRRRVNLVLTPRVAEIQQRYADSELTQRLAGVAARFDAAELEVVLRWFAALNHPNEAEG